ncbi:hypothetical protein DYB28_011748, partial [Aphanomyces astaci]
MLDAVPAKPSQLHKLEGDDLKIIDGLALGIQEPPQDVPARISTGEKTKNSLASSPEAMSDSDHQRSQSPVNGTERSRSREAERGRPVRRQVTTPFAGAFEEEPQDLEVLKKRLTTAIRFDTTILDADSRIGKMLDNLMRALERDDQAWVLDQEGKTLALQRNKALKSNVYRFVDWLRVHTAGYHLYAPVEDEKTSAPPATVAAAPSRPSKPGRSEGSVGSSSGPPWRAPAPEQDSAKYERKKATCLKCGSENHKVVNCPKCAPGESERLLKEQMDKWESARNRKVTKLQGSANKSLGREAKIEGIVSVTTTLLDTGSDVTLVT